MAQVTPQQWERLVTAYRVHGVNHKAASASAGVSAPWAQKAYLEPVTLTDGPRQAIQMVIAHTAARTAETAIQERKRDQTETQHEISRLETHTLEISEEQQRVQAQKLVTSLQTATDAHLRRLHVLMSHSDKLEVALSKALNSDELEVLLKQNPLLALSLLKDVGKVLKQSAEIARIVGEVQEQAKPPKRKDRMHFDTDEEAMLAIRERIAAVAAAFQKDDEHVTDVEIVPNVSQRTDSK